MNKEQIIKEMAKLITGLQGGTCDVECRLKCACEDCEYCTKEEGNIGCIEYALAENLFNAGYRKVGEDEIVVKKSEYEELKTNIEDLQTKLGAVMLCIKNTHGIDISDLLEKQKRATAREILQELKVLFGTTREFNWAGPGVGGIGDPIRYKIEQFAKDKGVEIGDTTYSEDKGND